MLIITIPKTEVYDEIRQEFIQINETKLQLEHSLISLSKWESRWRKPFLTKDMKTIEETMDYIKCMIIGTSVDPEIVRYLSKENIKAINEYIDAPMTATWFREDKNKTKSNREQITSELIYYWMISLNIPFECQKWHLNRLLTLIRVCNVKNQPPQKTSKKELLSRNAALNAARKKQLGTKG